MCDVFKYDKAYMVNNSCPYPAWVGKIVVIHNWGDGGDFSADCIAVGDPPKVSTTPMICLSRKVVYEHDSYSDAIAKASGTPTAPPIAGSAQSTHNFKVGDIVKVLRAPHAHENGWSKSWNPSMDKLIGGTYEILADAGVAGFKIIDAGCCTWYVPPFVLSPVANANPTPSASAPAKSTPKAAYKVGDVVKVNATSSFEKEWMGRSGVITMVYKNGLLKLAPHNWTPKCFLSLSLKPGDVSPEGANITQTTPLPEPDPILEPQAGYVKGAKVVVFKHPDPENIPTTWSDYHSNKVWSHARVLSVAGQSVRLKFGDWYDDGNEDIGEFPAYILRKNGKS